MNSIFKISIVIPVYNVEQYLKQCLDTIINQTYKNLEIILVDDGSTDNSGKICDEYALKDNRIKVIHKENGDLSSARNAGLDIATGDYIGFVDSDDYVKLDMFEKLYNVAVKTSADLVVCNWLRGYENVWIENKIFPEQYILNSNEALEKFNGNMFVWNKLFKREIIDSIHFIETYAEDVLFTFSALKKAHKIACINENQYYYRNNPNSRLNIKKFKKNYLFFLEVLDMEMNYAKENGLYKLKKEIYDTKLATIVNWLGMLALDTNLDIKSIEILLSIMKKNFIKYLKTRDKISKKVFLMTSCISFKLSSRIYKSMINIKKLCQTVL